MTEHRKQATSERADFCFHEILLGNIFSQSERTFLSQEQASMPLRLVKESMFSAHSFIKMQRSHAIDQSTRVICNPGRTCIKKKESSTLEAFQKKRKKFYKVV